MRIMGQGYPVMHRGQQPAFSSLLHITTNRAVNRNNQQRRHGDGDNSSSGSSAPENPWAVGILMTLLLAAGIAFGAYMGKKAKEEQRAEQSQIQAHQQVIMSSSPVETQRTLESAFQSEYAGTRSWALKELVKLPINAAEKIRCLVKGLRDRGNNEQNARDAKILALEFLQEAKAEKRLKPEVIEAFEALLAKDGTVVRTKSLREYERLENHLLSLLNPGK